MAIKTVKQFANWIGVINSEKYAEMLQKLDPFEAARIQAEE